jgi:predicted peptidase
VPSLRRLAVVLSSIAVALGCRRPGPPPSAEARALAARMEAGVEPRRDRRYPLPWRLFVPAGYDPQHAYPLVLYLHGADGRGTDDVGQLTGDVAALISDRVQAIAPAFVLAPQCPPGDEWVNRHDRPPFPNYVQAKVPESDAARMALEAIDGIGRRYHLDPDRIYVTGPSMGGSGTWDMITRHPERFAAAVPITGVNDPSRAPAIAHLPIWAFHGTQDTFSSVENTRAMVEALRRLGSPVRFSALDGVGHDAWTTAYADMEMYRWLFAQRRQASPAQGAGESAPR